MDFLKTLPNTYVFSVNQRSISGTPDIIGCINGCFVALELKAEKGVATQLQLHVLLKINLARGLGLLVRPSTWEETKKELSKKAGLQDVIQSEKQRAV